MPWPFWKLFNIYIILWGEEKELRIGEDEINDSAYNPTGYGVIFYSYDDDVWRLRVPWWNRLHTLRKTKGMTIEPPIETYIAVPVAATKSWLTIKHATVDRFEILSGLWKHANHEKSKEITGILGKRTDSTIIIQSRCESRIVTVKLKNNGRFLKIIKRKSSFFRSAKKTHSCRSTTTCTHHHPILIRSCLHPSSPTEMAVTDEYHRLQWTAAIEAAAAATKTTTVPCTVCVYHG